jgi:alpha-beta hydrolase superfamily lysophospholipase
VSSSKEGYALQNNWREIQAFLPPQYHLDGDRLPSEEWWDWRGHHIHLDRFRNPAAKARVILFHGVGTNGRQMSTILGRPLFESGLETVATDMPGYGVTKVAEGVTVGYDDWVQAGSDFVNTESERDSRPIFLYGLSAGGMLTYHVAAVNGNVKGIVGMTFLDQRNQQVADETAYNQFASRLGTPIIHKAVKLGMGSVQIPMRMASKMSALVNNKEALKAFYADKTSAGNWVSQKFLETYMSPKPAVEPEDFDVCPVLLTQPEQDRWSPLHLSEPFLKRIKRVPVKIVMLENASHYPIEEPGLTQMRDAILNFVNENI